MATHDEVKKYLGMLAETMMAEIVASNGIRKFTKNFNLIGMLAEATVRRFVERAVHPLRVSRGSIIYEDNCDSSSHSKLPELDTIIWTPSILPSFFEVGDFALVPRQDAMGVLEIKSTNYRDASEKVKALIDRTRNLITWPRDPTAAFNWFRGVVCIRNNATDQVLDELISKRSSDCFAQTGGRRKHCGQSSRRSPADGFSG